MSDGSQPSPSVPAPRRCCPVCREPKRETIGTKGDLVLLRCVVCGMTYLDPSVSRLADDRYYDAGGSSFYLNAGKLQADYSPVRFERELRAFRRQVTSGRVLDVGCSTGGFLHELGARFPGQYETWGTDVSTEPVNHAASQGINVWRDDFLRLQRTDLGSFQAITFWAVLEHLLEPRAFLEQAARMLDPDGFCFILVPNQRSLATRMLGVKYRYILLEHVNYFAEPNLRRLCQDQFEVVEATSSHFNPVVILQDAMGRGRPVPREQRIALLKQTTTLKQNRWLAPFRPLYYGLEALLARWFLADNLLFVLKLRAN